MKKEEVIKTVKQVATIIVSAGVGAIVGNAVRHTSPPDMSTIKKVCIGVGSLALGSMLSDKASEYTETKIDETVTAVKEAFSDPEESTDEPEVVIVE